MRRGSDTAEFSELVGAIYQCAIDVDRWPGALSRLHETLGFANASLSLISTRDANLGFNYLAGMAPEWQAIMADYVEDIIEMWGGRVQMLAYPFDRPTVLSHVASPAALAANRYVREWREPQGLTDSVVTILAHDREAICNMAMGRHRNAGRIDEQTLSQLTLLIPHLQRTIHIGRLLDRHRSAHRTFEQLIDGLAIPVIVVDRKFGLMHGNPAATEQLDRGDVLTMRDGRVAAVEPRVQQTLATTFAAQPFGGGSSIGLPMRAGRGRASAIHIMPLAKGAAAAIFLAPVSTVPERTCETLVAMFGLTNAEARMLDLVLRGNTIRAAAEALGIAPSTAKTHLLNIYAKTEVSRRAELLNLAAAISSPAIR